MLSSITVGYIDKENNDYKLIIELKDGEFVAGEPDKNENGNIRMKSQRH